MGCVRSAMTLNLSPQKVRINEYLSAAPQDTRYGYQSQVYVQRTGGYACTNVMPRHTRNLDAELISMGTLRVMVREETATRVVAKHMA